MSLRVLRREAHRAMPWKNGGGATLEVASWPPGASLDDFGWRVSFAFVDESGPFSRFPGVDRVIALARGACLVLSVQGLDVPLTPFTPFAFAGENEVACTVHGSTVDINLMTRRGYFEGEVAMHHLACSTLVVEPKRGASDSLIALLEGEMTALSAGGASVGLSPFDVLRHDAAIALSGTGVVAVIDVRSLREQP